MDADVLSSFAGIGNCDFVSQRLNGLFNRLQGLFMVPADDLVTPLAWVIYDRFALDFLHDGFKSVE